MNGAFRKRKFWCGPDGSLFGGVRALMGNRITHNIAANYVGAIVSAGVPLLVLPFLLHMLGRANWGLVSFATMLVAILAILNAGMAQSLIREFGSRWSDGEEGRKRTAQLLFAYQRIYWAAGALIAVLVLPFARIIASRWLILGEISVETAHWSIYCAVALFFAQLPGNLYGSALMAIDQQVVQNGVRAFIAVLKGAGGVAVAFLTRSVLCYLIFLVLSALVETLIFRHIVWRKMNADRATLRWNGIELRRSLGFSGKVSALVALGVLISQTDKFYLSMKVSVEDLGIYGIAYSLSMGILQLGYPLFSAMLPKLVEVRHDMASRASINARMLILILVANITMLAAYFIVGRQILEIWFGNRDTAGQVGAALTPLLISCALNSIYNLGYTNWISLGNSRWILGINLFGFAVALSVTPLAIDRFGYPGASAALLGLNSAGALCALTWLFLSRQRAARN